MKKKRKNLASGDWESSFQIFCPQPPSWVKLLTCSPIFEIPFYATAQSQKLPNFLFLPFRFSFLVSLIAKLISIC